MPRQPVEGSAGRHDRPNGHFADIITETVPRSPVRPGPRPSRQGLRPLRTPVSTSSMRNGKSENLTARFTSRWSLEDAMRQTLTEAMTARCFPLPNGMSAQRIELTNRRADGRRTLEGRMDGRTEGHLEGRMDGRTKDMWKVDGQTGSVTDGRY
ncbi:hypothetical protein BV898_11135 [Hypsibius exemplaris]|uniref:Uncharacterized protein n=1 Tax=Hypsibius exemplaris TaxID=2072580 RepID=A0A1W0WHE8_HYPEX|nr:hypothetical protein BV898_11135 [Hypsibius exemplaris]